MFKAELCVVFHVNLSAKCAKRLQCSLYIYVASILWYMVVSYRSLCCAILQISILWYPTDLYTVANHLRVCCRAGIDEVETDVVEIEAKLEKVCGKTSNGPIVNYTEYS